MMAGLTTTSSEEDTTPPPTGTTSSSASSSSSSSYHPRLERFSVQHHEKNRISYNEKMKWWENETSNERCRTCWLRHYDCYCTSLNKRRQHYIEQQQQGRGLQHVTTCMYYHYQEMGRSANTAHLLEAICPPEQFQVVMFGDVDAEQQLVHEIHQEAVSGTPITCVLYPTRDALLLSDWIAQRPPSCRDRPIRLVALDGTYAQASRQYKHLSKSLSLLYDHHRNSSPHPHPANPVNPANPSDRTSDPSLDPAEWAPSRLPVVKLDLEQGWCDSALAGIQHQPNAEKICTYQAVVMAMRQAGERPELCASLAADLDAFLTHILTKRIKFGNTTIRNSTEFKPTPMAFVADHLAKHPPPVGPAPAGTTRSSRRRQRDRSRASRRQFSLEVPDYMSSLFTIIPTYKFAVYSQSLFDT